MARRLPAAALVACALAASPFGEPPAAAAPAAPRPAPSVEWETIKDASESCSVDIPKGSEEGQSTVHARILTRVWPEEGWKKLRLEVNAYPGQVDPKHLATFGISNIKGQYGPGGRHEALEGFPTRFVNIPDSEEKRYLAYTQAAVAGKIGFLCTLIINRDLWEEKRGDFDRILDSFKGSPPPEDTYVLPEGWKKVLADFVVVMGPVDPKDKALAQKQEDRLHQVRAQWLDGDKAFRCYRELFEDTRKLVARAVVRVYPTTAEYRAAAGAAARPGVPAVYLPDDKEKAVVADGSEGGGLTFPGIFAPVGLQYVESMTGPLPAWVRSGFLDYWEGAALRDSNAPFPGAMHEARMAHAKEAFRRKPPKFADLKAMDGAALDALGDDGRAVAWAFFHYLMHGPDEGPRNEFRRCLRETKVSKDWAKSWEATHPKEDTKKVDSGCAKWVRDFKPKK